MGLWPELINNGYESENKWADGLYQLQQLQRFNERAPHDCTWSLQSTLAVMESEILPLLK